MSGLRAPICSLQGISSRRMVPSFISSLYQVTPIAASAGQSSRCALRQVDKRRFCHHRCFSSPRSHGLNQRRTQATRNASQPEENSKKDVTPISKRKKFQGRVSTDSLAPHDSIYLQHNQPPSPTPPTETPQEKRSVLIANKFFRQRCKLLYEADSFIKHRRNDFVSEVIILGASNAGKSSFLNSLFGRTDAAAVSSKPGRTVTMSAYGVGLPNRPRLSDISPTGIAPSKHSLIMMDTPGYGYASQRSWGDTISKYIEKRKMLKGAVLLIPAEKSLSRMDKWILKLLAEHNKRTLVVITKADKGGKEWWANCDELAGEIRGHMRRLGTSLNNGWNEGDGWVPEIYVTAAGWSNKRSVFDAPGMGGARKAILEHLAGFKLGNKVETRPEDIEYGGDVISFEDLDWK